MASLINTASREPFLKDPVTHEVLEEIAGSHELVLYCGAGVTRDRSGVGWDELVRSTFDLASKRKHDKALAAAVGHVLRNDRSPAKQKASMVFETFKKSGERETTFLRPYLHKILYEKNGWSQGYLLRNVAQLAVYCAYLGKPISLITTNYDDYLDTEILQALAEFFDEPALDEPIPGVRCNVLSNPMINTVLREAVNSDQYIDIYFVHGRVDNHGNASGDVVFSENSYSDTYRRTVDFLLQRFGKNAALLTLGASINDEPLIEALTVTKPHAGPRFALTTVSDALLRTDREESWERLDLETVERALNQRSAHLGLRSLFPANFSQAAQFVEELRIMVLLKFLGMQASYMVDASYPARLATWWREWETSTQASSPEKNHRVLRETLGDLEARFERDGLKRDREVLRLEVWIRKDPSVRRNRQLTLFANSTGPLMVESALRAEPIDRFSQIASVRAFNEGKPILVGLDDLEFSASSTRWKTFLAAPVFLEREVNVGDAVVAGSVPVGVVTLSSTFPIRGNRKESFSVLADKALTNQDYTEILAHVLGAGRELANPA